MTARFEDTLAIQLSGAGFNRRLLEKRGRFKNFTRH